MEKYRQEIAPDFAGHLHEMAQTERQEQLGRFRKGCTIWCRMRWINPHCCGRSRQVSFLSFESPRVARSATDRHGVIMHETTAPTSAACPCCGREVILAEQDNLKTRDNRVWPAVASMAAHGKYFSWHSSQERLLLYWACNDCLGEGRAIRADHQKQKWCDCEAYFAYFDEARTCVDCGTTFVFTKEEQKRWYETLQFWVWSRPIRCKACNAQRKQRHRPA